jgi:hypothetical protein
MASILENPPAQRHIGLAQIKSRYDPNNAFHVNQNIRPSS